MSNNARALNSILSVKCNLALPRATSSYNYHHGMVWGNYGMPYVYYMHVPDVTALS